jgi:hypothetical protein
MTEGEISNELKKMFGQFLAAAFVGKVTNVDNAESDALIEVEHNELTYDVKLKSVVDSADKHLIQVPKVGSYVFCVSLGNSDEKYMAVLFNEVEKVIYQGENISLVIDDQEGTIVINDGENGGLIKIEELVSKINALESKVNELLQTLQAVVIPLAPSGTYPFATDFGDITPIQPETQVSDIENDKIKH